MVPLAPARKRQPVAEVTKPVVVGRHALEQLEQLAPVGAQLIVLVLRHQLRYGAVFAPGRTSSSLCGRQGARRRASGRTRGVCRRPPALPPALLRHPTLRLRLWLWLWLWLCAPWPASPTPAPRGGAESA